MPEINETPSIDNEIEILANATFGEEVRQAIIDALIKCYTDVINTVMTYVKKGDSITDADINQNGELVLTITNNETQTSRTETVGTVVGSDGDDGAGIQSIRLDTTVGSSTYGHLFIQVQGQTETDIGYIIGPKGDPGETAPEHEWNVDGSFSQSSVNPVQNKVITAKLNEIMTDKLNKTDVDSILSTTRTNPVQNKVITSALNGKLNKSSVDDTFSQSSTNPVQNKTITAKLNEIIAGKIDKVSMSSNHVLASNGSGGVKDSTKLIGNSNYFHSGSDYLALESAVKQYTYSKSESDNKYVQISQIDDELDDESENPVQNKVIAEKFAEFEENYSAPESALNITSTNAVQNKVITEALNGKVNISDFNNTIFDDVDLVFSNTNGGIYYGGDCPAAPALFIEAEGGVPDYPSGYAYYLSYVDSLYDSDDNPHWHRIANISNLITRVIPVDNELSEFSKNPVQSKTIKAALDKKMEYVDESYGPQSLDDINHFTDPNKIYHFYLGLNNINEMVDLIFIINDDEADWDNEVYPYSCQFMLSQSGKIYYRKTDDQGLFGQITEITSQGMTVDDHMSISSTNPVQNKVITNELDKSKNGSIPSYWENDINTAIGKVKAIQRAHGADCINLVWFSDIHLMASIGNSNYGRNIPALARRLINKLDIPLVVSTGDSATNSVEPTEAAMRADFDYFNELIRSAGISDKLINCYGNHDGAWGDNRQGTEGYLAAYAWHIRPRDYWNDLIRNQTTGADRHYSEDGSYGYVNFPGQKLRIVQLNSFWVGDNDTYYNNGTMIYDYMHHGGYGQDQLDWLAEEALRFDEDGWSVLFLAHMPPASIDGSNYLAEDQNRDAVILNGILTAYANKTAYQGTYTYNSGRKEGAWANVSVNVDFSSESHYAKPIAFLAGHCHKSRIINDVLSFPIITITCATNSSYDSSTEGSRTNNTATETAFDVISICKDEEKIYLTRLGVGSDRETSYIPISPVINQIPISTDENGDIYNGTGYKDGYRFNSSGSESAVSGYFVTGYIPVSNGDVVTLDGFAFGTLSGTPSPSYCYIECYVADKTRKEGLSGAWVNTGTNADLINAVRDTNGYLTKFTINNETWAMNDIAYIRISGYGSGADAEIYVS